MRAGGGDEEEAEGDAADLEVLPQRVGDVGPPDRPRHPHDHRAPASPVHVDPVVAVAVVVMAVVVVVVMMMVAVAVAVTAVRAGGEEQGRARGEGERRPAGKRRPAGERWGAGCGWRLGVGSGWAYTGVFGSEQWVRVQGSEVFAVESVGRNEAWVGIPG